MRSFTKNVAYNALCATHVAAYNRAKAQNAYYIGAPRTMGFGFPRLPVYVATLINTIGPVRSEGFLCGGLQVPYLDDAEVVALEPVGYQEYRNS